jgi:hypothetical protein
MSNNKLSRIIAALIMAFLAALMVHIMDAKEHHLGREAYLAKEAVDFDDETAHPSSFVRYLIFGLITSCLYIGLYEILSFFIRKILERLNADDSSARSAEQA